MEAWHIWLIAGLAIALAELVLPGFYMLSFGIAAAITAPISLLVSGLVWQLLVFVPLGIVILIFARRLFLEADKLNPGKDTKTNVGGMEGKIGVVTKPVSSLERGYVKVGGELWTAIYPIDDGKTLEPGTKVKVKGVEGNKLIVVPD